MKKLQLDLNKLKVNTFTTETLKKHTGTINGNLEKYTFDDCKDIYSNNLSCGHSCVFTCDKSIDLSCDKLCL